MLQNYPEGSNPASAKHCNSVHYDLFGVIWQDISGYTDLDTGNLHFFALICVGKKQKRPVTQLVYRTLLCFAS